jgi:DNA-binding transcriptional MerR regulator
MDLEIKNMKKRPTRPQLTDIFPFQNKKTTWTPAEVARIIGKHPNTVRKYEDWGFIHSVARRANGYRSYSRENVLEALFSAVSLRVCFQEWKGRRRMKDLVGKMLTRDFQGCFEVIHIHRKELLEGLDTAMHAKGILEGWKAQAQTAVKKKETEIGQQMPEALISRKAAARETGISVDTLRDWERDSLVTPARSQTGNRLYSLADRQRLTLVRMLRQAGYSYMGILSLFNAKTRMEDLTYARDRWDRALAGFINDSYLLEEIIRAIEKEIVI